MCNRMKRNHLISPFQITGPPAFYCQVRAFCPSSFLPPDSVQSGRKKNATQTHDLFSGTPNSSAVCHPITFTGSWQDGPGKWPRPPLWSQTAPPHWREKELCKHVLRSCYRPGIEQGFWDEEQGNTLFPPKSSSQCKVVNWWVLPRCSAQRRATFCNPEEEGRLPGRQWGGKTRRNSPFLFPPPLPRFFTWEQNDRPVSLGQQTRWFGGGGYRWLHFRKL